MGTPETKYADNAGVSIAYQVVDDGPVDLVFVCGTMSHLDLWWCAGNREPEECANMTENEDSVKLLSGGNPQIPKGDGDEPVQAYLAAMPEWKGRIGRHLDELVREVVPQARRAVRWNSPFYGIEGKGWFLSLHCFTKYVKVTWLNGGELDPPPPDTSKYDYVRYLNIGEGDEIDDDQLRDWLRQAASIPGEDTF